MSAFQPSRNLVRESTPSLPVSDSPDLSKKSHTGEEAFILEAPQKAIFHYWTLVCLCLMIAFGGFIFGWDTGTISGFVNETDFIERFGEQREDGTFFLSTMRTGLIVAIFNIGCAVGGIVLSRLGDSYGRKIGLIVVISIYIVGIAIQISSTTVWYQYFAGRIVSGLGVGGIAVLSPMLISEVSPKHLRGNLVSCYQLMITAGILLGYCANFGTKNFENSAQWRVPLGLGFVWALLMIGGMLFVPESPRYLIEAGKVEEAKHSIAISNKLKAGDATVESETEILQVAIEAEREVGNASWGELFNIEHKIFQRLFMGCMLQSLQQLTGCNYFFYYGTLIFQSIGLEDSFQTSIILGAVNFASTFVALYVVEKFGRRKCLLWGSSGMAVCMLIYATVGVTALYPNGEDQPSSVPAGTAMIAFACGFIFCFATTWAPIPFVVNSETFPLRVKAKCMAVAQACNWIWGFIIGLSTPFIADAINFAYGYVFFGCLIFGFFFVLFVIPETKGLSLEEVNTLWEEGVKPWKSSSWVPPSRRA